MGNSSSLCCCCCCVVVEMGIGGGTVVIVIIVGIVVVSLPGGAGAGAGVEGDVLTARSTMRPTAPASKTTQMTIPRMARRDPLRPVGLAEEELSPALDEASGLTPVRVPSRGRRDS